MAFSFNKVDAKKYINLNFFWCIPFKIQPDRKIWAEVNQPLENHLRLETPRDKPILLNSTVEKSIADPFKFFEPVDPFRIKTY